MDALDAGDLDCPLGLGDQLGRRKSFGVREVAAVLAGQEEEDALVEEEAAFVLLFEDAPVQFVRDGGGHYLAAGELQSHRSILNISLCL